MYEIIGIRHVEYTRKNGEPAQGYEINVAWDYSQADGGNAQGRACDRVWMAADAFQAYADKLQVGALMMPVYNSRGRLQGWVDSPAD